jgi:hypothetical protein
MASKLPDGFRSWAEVVDYLNSKDVKYRTVRMQTMGINGVVATRKITLRTAERNAWREIDKHRLDKQLTYAAISGIAYCPHLQDTDKDVVINFLENSQRSL